LRIEATSYQKVARQRMKGPQVSVIMPVYNGEKYIVEAIESILNQSYKDYEIIIVNDGSTDDTFNKIRSYLQLSNIKYVRQENRGLPAALNTGIKAASGEYIAFLDCDDLWMPHKLDMQMVFMKEHPEVGLVHGNISYVDQHGDPFTPDSPYKTDISGNCFPELFMGNRIAVLTVLIKKESITNVGFFNEDFKYADDYDMWLRVSRHYPLGHIDKCLAAYRKHPGGISSNINAHNADVLKVLEETLKQFPDTWRIVGKDKVKERLFHLTNHLAALCFNSGKYVSALRYFLKASNLDVIRFGPRSLGTLFRLFKKS
jgi:glycosyltransferase involved in cell wall biosynthesis